MSREIIALALTAALGVGAYLLGVLLEVFLGREMRLNRMKNRKKQTPKQDETLITAASILRNYCRENRRFQDGCNKCMFRFRGICLIHTPAIWPVDEIRGRLKRHTVATSAKTSSAEQTTKNERKAN